VNDVVYYRSKDDSIGWSNGGSVTVTIPLSTLRDLYKRARASLGYSGPYVPDSDEELSGFFDFVKKAVSSVGKAVTSLASSPIVRAVAGVIPYGATALTVVDLADKALGSAKKSISKKPKTHALVYRAAKGDPSAKAALKSLPPDVREKVRKAALLQGESLRLAAQLKAAKESLVRAGYTPGLQRSLKLPAAPWSK
jgi:hypothetical protein